MLLSLYIIAFFAELTAKKEEDSSNKGIQRQCRAILTGLGFSISLTIFNCCIFTLIIFMSIQFCKPLDG